MIRTPVMLALAVVALGVSPAVATPYYGIREHKTCDYCHKTATGGPLNPRGTYYQNHNHTFEGYDELRVMGRFSTPFFHEAWRDVVPASTIRIGVGDTAGDGSPRLVLLAADKDSRSLTVQKWDGKSWQTEFTKPLPVGTDRMALGAYAKDRPAVIVTSTGLWYRSGTAYETKPAPRHLDILGTVVQKDGLERLLVRESDGLYLYRVDPGANDWLVEKSGAPAGSAGLTFTEMKAPTDELTAIGIPQLLAGGGIVGLWDARKSDNLFFYAVQLVALVDANAKPTRTTDPTNLKPDVVIKGHDVYLTVVSPRPPLQTLWHSPKLSGTVLDVVLGDPRSNARGLSVLTDSGPEGKGRTLYFFQLD